MSDRPYLRRESSGAVLLQIWVQPGAARSGFAGLHGDRLKIRICAPPVDGKANEELVRFLSKALGLPRSQVEVSAAASARGKTVRLEGADEKILSEQLP